ncbi:DUF6759 domain-containing protein [Chryseobacterium sp. Leaf394]|uniref:DUF6759 domain-containing protein n=1 Tax=Chryseobacterium sp. Leaf394 TaxID=1736361 RepID=UPI000FF88F05|nr:DUF6759 domain-containing protein [Chryseobacterium sp. Leaf394]
MEKYLAVMAIMSAIACGTKPVLKKPVQPQSSKKYTSAPVKQTETAYKNLSKTEKQETAEVLNDILNGSSDSPNTSISVHNKSRCNMVLSISGPNFSKQIPIPAGKTGSTMVPKNQKYNLSGMVCQSVYNNSKYVTGTYSISLSE